MKKKMNGLFKTSFILLLCCLPLLCIAIFVAYALDNITLSCVISAFGVLLAFLGIIFATFSKPKKIKHQEKSENDVDNL